MASVVWKVTRRCGQGVRGSEGFTAHRLHCRGQCTLQQVCTAHCIAARGGGDIYHLCYLWLLGGREGLVLLGSGCTEGVTAGDRRVVLPGFPHTLEVGIDRDPCDLRDVT